MYTECMIGECQFYMDVDCSSFTYDTPASAGVLSAVQRAQACVIVIIIVIVIVIVIVISIVLIIVTIFIIISPVGHWLVFLQLSCEFRRFNFKF